VIAIEFEEAIKLAQKGYSKAMFTIESYNESDDLIRATNSAMSCVGKKED